MCDKCDERAKQLQEEVSKFTSEELEIKQQWWNTRVKKALRSATKGAARSPLNERMLLYAILHHGALLALSSKTDIASFTGTAATMYHDLVVDRYEEMLEEDQEETEKSSEGDNEADNEEGQVGPKKKLEEYDA